MAGDTDDEQDRARSRRNKGKERATRAETPPPKSPTDLRASDEDDDVFQRTLRQSRVAWEQQQQQQQQQQQSSFQRANPPAALVIPYTVPASLSNVAGPSRRSGRPANSPASPPDILHKKAKTASTMSSQVGSPMDEDQDSDEDFMPTVRRKSIKSRTAEQASKIGRAILNGVAKIPVVGPLIRPNQPAPAPPPVDPRALFDEILQAAHRSYQDSDRQEPADWDRIRERYEELNSCALCCCPTHQRSSDSKCPANVKAQGPLSSVELMPEGAHWQYFKQLVEVFDTKSSSTKSQRQLATVNFRKSKFAMHLRGVYLKPDVLARLEGAKFKKPQPAAQEPGAVVGANAEALGEKTIEEQKTIKHGLRNDLLEKSVCGIELQGSIDLLVEAIAVYRWIVTRFSLVIMALRVSAARPPDNQRSGLVPEPLPDPYRHLLPPVRDEAIGILQQTDIYSLFVVAQERKKRTLRSTEAESREEFVAEAEEVWRLLKNRVNRSLFESRGYRSFISNEELSEMGLETWGDSESVLLKLRGQQFAIESASITTDNLNNQRLNMEGRLKKATKAFFTYSNDVEEFGLSDSKINSLAAVITDSFCYREKQQASIALKADRDPPPIPVWTRRGALFQEALTKGKDAPALDDMAKELLPRMHKVIEFFYKSFEDAFFNGLGDDGRLPNGRTAHSPLPICDSVFEKRCSKYLKWAGPMAYAQHVIDILKVEKPDDEAGDGAD
ncbi:hypothetical protein HDV05_006681, partial [Chytridiales sp. JEL 0842]